MRSVAINLSCHLVASDEPFIMPHSRTQRDICMIVLFGVRVSIFAVPYNTNERIKNKTAQ